MRGAGGPACEFLLIAELLLVRGQCTTCRSVSEKKACLIVLVLVLLITVRC